MTAGKDVPTMSKTRRKREAEALQALAEELVALEPGLLEKLPLPGELRTEIDRARGMREHGALRRQKQYLGKLMRSIDPAPIRAALTRLREPARRRIRHLHACEQWRDRLLAEGETALAAFLEIAPACAEDELRPLLARARANHEDRASRRALFRAVAGALDAAAEPANPRPNQ